jgi:DNA-binding MarR family transcriptional regulator
MTEQRSVAALGEQVLLLQRSLHALRQQQTAGSATSSQGVEWAAYGLLFQLVARGPQRSSALADAACVDPSTVSRQVAQLVKADLVERQSDPDDGRASILVATERGRAAYQAKLEHRERLFADVLDGWSDVDVATLTALLTRLNESFAQFRATPIETAGDSTESAATTSEHDLEETA